MERITAALSTTQRATRMTQRNSKKTDLIIATKKTNIKIALALVSVLLVISSPLSLASRADKDSTTPSVGQTDDVKNAKERQPISQQETNKDAHQDAHQDASDLPVFAAVEDHETILECPIQYDGASSSWKRFPTSRIYDQLVQFRDYKNEDKSKPLPKEELLTSDISIVTSKYPQRYSVLQSPANYELHIKQTTFWDAGIYECGRGDRKWRMKLMVVSKPKCYTGRNVIEGTQKRLGALCDADFSALDKPMSSSSSSPSSSALEQPKITWSFVKDQRINSSASTTSSSSSSAASSSSQASFTSTGDYGITHQAWSQLGVKAPSRSKSLAKKEIDCRLDFPRWTKGQHSPSCRIDLHDFPSVTRDSLSRSPSVSIEGKAHQAAKFVDLVVFEGTPVKMDCNISKPYMWQRKTKTRGWDDLFIGDELTADSDLPDDHFRLQHLPTHNFYRLSLPRAEFVDAGVYTCTSEAASEQTGSGPSTASHVAIYNLMVIGKPECHIPYNVTEHVVGEGREMNARCSLRYEQLEAYLPTPLLSWKRGDDVFYAGVTDAGDDVGIHFKIHPRDVGYKDIECQVRHRNLQPYPYESHHSRCVIPLANRRFPPKILGPIIVEEDASSASRSSSSSSSSSFVSLTCSAVGSPPPKIDWRVDGELRQSSGLRLLSDSFNGSRVQSRLRLSLDAVRDSGVVFECHAANQLGRVAKSVTVAPIASNNAGGGGSGGGVSASLFGDNAPAWYVAVWVMAVATASLVLTIGVAATTLCIWRRRKSFSSSCHHLLRSTNYDKMEKTMIVRAPEAEGGELPEMEWDHL